jgi:hypothetical protein
MASQLMSLKDEIRRAHAKCVTDAQSAVKHAIKCGKLLNEVKPLVAANPATPPFGDWVDEYLPFSRRTAQAYIKLYNDLQKLPPRRTSALLREAPSINGLIKLLPKYKKPQDEREDATDSHLDEDPDETRDTDTVSEVVDVTPRPSRGSEKDSAATLVDSLHRQHVGHIARGLTTIAEVNGGEGRHFSRANAGLNELIHGLQAMREGKQ